jgi:hypothetical protein
MEATDETGMWALTPTEKVALIRAGNMTIRCAREQQLARAKAAFTNWAEAKHPPEWTLEYMDELKAAITQANKLTNDNPTDQRYARFKEAWKQLTNDAPLPTQWTPSYMVYMLENNPYVAPRVKERMEQQNRNYDNNVKDFYADKVKEFYDGIKNDVPSYRASPYPPPEIGVPRPEARKRPRVQPLYQDQTANNNSLQSAQGSAFVTPADPFTQPAVTLVEVSPLIGAGPAVGSGLIDPADRKLDDSILEDIEWDLLDPSHSGSN